jgi:hypothetical protein
VLTRKVYAAVVVQLLCPPAGILYKTGEILVIFDHGFIRGNEILKLTKKIVQQLVGHADARLFTSETFFSQNVESCATFPRKMSVFPSNKSFPSGLNGRKHCTAGFSVSGNRIIDIFDISGEKLRGVLFGIVIARSELPHQCGKAFILFLGSAVRRFCVSV